MIVDSPGVGESEAMNEFVLNYLPQAFCFIYVIKSNNAGGVQKDRVRGHTYTAIKIKIVSRKLSLFNQTNCELILCSCLLTAAQKSECLALFYNDNFGSYLELREHLTELKKTTFHDNLYQK